ncbi:MAG: thioredoxin family protein [Bauldia sp.]|nr:thioredoxin family protein [Bauldia sp.]MCW5717621.1 thioredoxin family protein [Bauldia sp.]MCW5929957.1 thioredoxin family protein [Chitinophagaceae bacterium]
MRLRNAVGGLLLGAGAALPAPAAALERVDYTTVGYEEAIAADVPVIVGVWADWCGICQTQIGIIEALADDPRFANLLVIEVSFDTQRHIMIRLNASFRSTIIGMRGGREIGRLNAETDAAAIEAFMASVVGPQM